MSTVRELISRLSIAVESPDGTVLASASADGVRVEIDPEALGDHDEESLAEQIEGALAGVVEEHGAAVLLLRARLRGEGVPEPPPGSDFVRRRERLSDEVARITSTVHSPRGHVSMEWFDEAEFLVIVKRGTLDALDRTRIEAEINAAVAALWRVRDRQARRAYWRIYGHDRFARRER